MTVEETKHPLSSKTVLSLLPVIAANLTALVPVIQAHGDMVQAAANALLPPQYLLIFNIVAAAAAAAFRVYSSGIKLEKGAPMKLMK
jgi:hypothetical protein